MKKKSILVLVFTFASMIVSSCGCGEKNATHDSGPGTSDSDTDADTDSGVDSGEEPIDPDVDWVTITEGSFVFGSPEVTPCIGPVSEKQVPVSLTHPFIISRYEITQKQWIDLGFSFPQRAPECSDCPITFLNAYEAMAWCNALSDFEGLEPCYDLSTCTGDIGGGCPDGDFYELGCLFIQGSSPSEQIEGLYSCAGSVRRYASMYDCDGYRLPTGPEWEYAAKAGTTTNTYNGDMTNEHSQACADEPILNDIAWYCENTGAGDENAHPEQLREVGTKQPNPWGLHDVLGNAGEWVDYVSTGYPLDTNEGKPGESLVDPMGTTEDSDGRGDVRGGWFFQPPCYTRAAFQFQDLRVHREASFGFRPVRTLPATAPDAGVK